MDILLGILLVLFGLAVTFFGLQVFFATLPILGFIFGFFLGAGGVESIWGDSFLSTATGWIVGFVLGALFGLISWIWWYAGVLLGAGAFGAALGTGILHLFDKTPSDWLLFIFAALGFVTIVVLALLLLIAYLVPRLAPGELRAHPGRPDRFGPAASALFQPVRSKPLSGLASLFSENSKKAIFATRSKLVTSFLVFNSRRNASSLEGGVRPKRSKGPILAAPDAEPSSMPPNFP